MVDEKKIVTDNINILKQGRELIKNISPGTYKSAIPGMEEGTIGAHFRHCLEVYQCFLKGIYEKCVDYDDRPRSKELESDPDIAIITIDHIILGLERICDIAWPSSHKMICWNNDNTCKVDFNTSIGRELMYLINHTIHHYALIKVTLLYYGITVEDRFGVAASTLAYREKGKPAEIKMSS